MKTHSNNIISLYKTLLELSENERKVIADSNLDEMEYNWLLKENVIREIEKMNDGSPWNVSREESTEIESLIRRIMAVHKANKDAVRKMKDDLLNDISTLSKGKKAVRAYQSF